ncbi:MAG TPA: amidohydrolase family protein, partial [Bacteroidia bacterium]|nr:amidohydrolase family protein [Bacteroidia bacterium]
MKKLLCVISAFAVLHGAQAQLTTFQTNGAPDKRHTVFAFTNAHIQADAETVIGNGTMLVQDGMITDIGTTVNIPKGAVVYDMQGKWIYPSFIDPYTTYGMPEPKRSPWTPGPQYFSARDGAYGWNDALKPETDASAVFSSDKKAAEEMRGLGFGTVMVYSNDGIARGTASCVTLNAEDGDNSVFVKQKVANCLSFDKGTSRQEYPSSLMGAIALLRQTYYDADWYRTAKNRKEFNLSLEAWNNVQSLPQIFETTDKWNVLRADKVGDEFNIQYIFKGSGNEYQRMNEMKNTNASFILPLNFPKAFDVSDPYDAEQIAYTDLKHWEMAPLNPGAFEKYGINFALTTSDLEDKKDFWENLRKAIKFGLSEKAALKALTTVPAQLLGIADKTGALKKGLLANFIITNGNVFTDDAVIWENWVKGKQYILRDANTVDVRGTYSMTVGGNPMTLDVEGDIFKPRGSFKKIDSIKGPVNVSCDGNRVDISWTYKKSGTTVLLTGLIDPKTKAMSGSGQEPDGTWIKWSATQTAPFTPKPEPKDTTAPDIPSLDDVIYPFAPFGRTIKDSLEIDRFQM